MLFLQRPPVAALRRPVPLGRTWHRYFTVSRVRPTMASAATPSETQLEPFPVGASLVGQSGKSYTILNIINIRRDGFRCIYGARSGETDFIIKHGSPVWVEPEGQRVSRQAFANHERLHREIGPSPFVRTSIDSMPEHLLFVYPFMNSDFLRLPKSDLSDETKKVMLKSALTGLAVLHDNFIYHGDVKPNNILVDCEELSGADDVIVRSVKLADLEDAVQLRGKVLKGIPSGNQYWRSPESWARAAQSTPSDVYSFAIVAVWVMRRNMLFYVSPEDRSKPKYEEKKEDGPVAVTQEWEEVVEEKQQEQEDWWPILRRHVSYFADEESFEDLLRLVGEDNPFYARLRAIEADFDGSDPERGMYPFKYWTAVDPVFKDLVCKMTDFNPKKRITAREALRHPFFDGVKTVPETLE